MNPTNVQEYAKCAQHLVSKPTILYVSAAAVEEKKETFDSLWEKARPVPNTQAVRCVHTESFGVITIAKNTSCVGTVYSTSSSQVITHQNHQYPHRTRPSDSQRIRFTRCFVQSGMWYAVHWEEKKDWFIGQAVCAVFLQEYGSLMFFNRRTQW